MLLKLALLVVLMVFQTNVIFGLKVKPRKWQGRGGSCMDAVEKTAWATASGRAVQVHLTIRRKARVVLAIVINQHFWDLY